MKFRRLFFWALSLLFMLTFMSMNGLADEYREVQASEILERIESGENINLTDCRIIGELNLSKIQLETVPNPKYYELFEPIEPLSETDYFESFGVNEDLKVVESNITICDSIFVDNLDFSNAIFKKPVYFVKVNCSSKANFISTNFSNGAGFKYTTFGDSVSFYESVFGDSANFSESTFGDSTNFQEATFGDLANFYGVTFGDCANFAYTIFGNLVNFEEATFGNETYFGGATLGNSADFSESTFGNYTNFQEATFGDDVDFNRITFGDSTSFEAVTFGDSTSFEAVSFGDFTDFSFAIFGDNTFFLGTVFSGVIDFWDATFGDSVHFGGGKVTFNAGSSEKITYKEATFGNDAHFGGATFGDYANFDGVIFDGSADFSGATFGNSASFYETNFSNTSSFDWANFNGAVDFSDTKFKAVTLNNTDFEEMKVIWDSLENSLIFYGPTYVKLIKNFRDAEQFEDADAAYFQYRKYCQAEKSWIPFSSGGSKWWDIIMWLTCGYGVKPFRAFYLGGLIVLLFSFTYLGLPDISWPSERNTDNAKKSAVKTLLSSVPKISWPNPGISRLSDSNNSIQKVTFWDSVYFSVVTFSTIGFGDWYPKDSFRKWVMLEGLFGWITLSLFLVTLTNVMMRP